ncbi:hypothetical protein BGZ83_011966 [Gryganskiella cystojenkinii]|nr:hypothetical protein BGZ83_011966 [Gryganskiella cystojenkinii]
MDPRSEMCLTALSVEHGSGWTDTTIDRLLEQTDPSSSSTTSIASTASASTSSTSSTSSIVTITTAPLTPRSQRPKPSPITTRSLKRAGSLPLSSNNTSLLSRNSEGPPSNTRLDHRQLSEQTEPGQEDTAPETNADAFGSGDEDGRDSGIALEKWDGPQRLQLETGIEAACYQGYPVESRAPGQEQQQQQSGGNRRRRERCRSMMHPSTPRAVDNDDLDIWSRSDVEVELHSLESKRDSSRRHGRASDTKVDSGTVDAAGKRKTRQKRVSSMVFGSDLRSQLNSTANGLPPLPLFQTQQQQIQQQQRTAATTVEAPLPSSFFHSPSPQEKEATSRSGKDKATLNLSRPTSPIGHQHQQLSGFGPSIPFSNLLDLATAKAENITGLYFARQLNVSATQLQDEPRQESATTNVGKEHSSLLDGPLSPSTMASSITININAASPAPAPASSDSEPLTLGSGLTATQNALHSGLAVERTVSTLPPLPNFNATGRPAPRRSRAVTSSGNTSSCSLSSFSFPPTTPPKDPRTENTSRSSLTSTPTNGTGSGMLSSPGTHRRSHSASHFFHLSSLKRHSPAQFNLALCYEHGQGGVEQDLAKALYFYQQAADQGHTKASYNIGCLCYNEGEIRKAIAWFEGAGKCRIRGLHPMDVSTATPLSSSSRIECPMPRQDLLFPHELEDLLRGESTTNDDSCASGGPFTVYLPAILCLALLCRQGIKDPKDGSVILKSDPVQAAELLQRLVQKAPAALTTSWDELSETKGESSRPCTRLNGRQRQASSSGALSSARTLLDKETTSVLPTDDGTGRATSQFSSSCPALSTMNQVKPLDCSFSTAASLSKRTRNKRSSFVEDAVDDDDVDLKKPFQQPQSYVPLPPRPSTPSTIPPPGTADAHESWAVQLAQRLLKIWRSDTERQQNPVKKMTKKSTTVVADQDQKILRYHLLYITNPTLTKNLYNLGVLYDLLLNDRPMAIKCYTFAFQNSHSSLSPTTSQRINCAWNMGVLYSKAQEWPLARDWFLRSQEDIRLLEINEKKSTAMTRGLFCNSVMTKDKSKSPSMRQARKHGLWIHPPPSSPSLADSSLMSSTPKEEDVVLATDSDKVALVLRWIDSKLH